VILVKTPLLKIGLPGAVLEIGTELLMGLFSYIFAQSCGSDVLYCYITTVLMCKINVVDIQ